MRKYNTIIYFSYTLQFILIIMGKRLDILLVVDIEATCWENNPPEGEVNEIIEVGIVSIDMVKHVVERKEGILVKPQFSKVSPFCTQLTTLTQEQVDTEGVSFTEACHKLRKKYDSRNVAWASWGDYDRKQFERNAQLYKTQYPFSNSHLNIKTMFSIFGGFTYELGMREALTHCGLTLEGTHHRGVDDAYNISRILLEILPKKA